MKKIMYLLLTLLIVIFVMGCGATKTSTGAKTDPKAFVENILKLDISQQYNELYNQVHPDDQAEYPIEEFIADNKANAPSIELIKDYNVGSYIILPTWVNIKGSGKEYKDVAEVSYTFNLKNGTTANSNMHIVKASDGKWRSFSSPINKQVDFGKESELGQFGFKVLKVENTKEAKTPTKSISVTTNTYEIVKLEVTNKRSAPAELFDFKIELMDLDKKTVYNLNSEVSIDINSTLKAYDEKSAVYLFDDLNPNLKNNLTLVYEVPTNANYALIITYKEDGLSLKLK